MTSQAGKARRSLDESSWKGPTMEKLEAEGLGAGFDPTRPELTLEQQITPTTNNLRRIEVGPTHEDVHVEVRSESHIRHMISSDLEASAGKQIGLHIGFKFKDHSSSKKGITIEGKKIRKETVSFKDQLDADSSIRLVTLLTEAAKEKQLNYYPGKGIDAKIRYKICVDVIRTKNSGATHFISSVELGAKYYQITTEDEERDATDNGIDVGAEIDGAVGGGKFAFATRDQLLELQKNTNRRVYRIGDVYADPQEMSKEREKTIDYSIKPIWSLIKDDDWQESVKKACLEYLPTHVPVGRETPILIRTASSTPRYLKVANPSKGRVVIEGTDKRTEAAEFFLGYQDGKGWDFENKLTETGSPFSLRVLKGGEQHFLTPDKKIRNKNQVVLRKTISGNDGKFILATPDQHEDTAVSEWQNGEPLLIRGCKKRRRLFFSSPQKYLALSNSTDSGSTPLKVKPKKRIGDSDLDSQFCIEMP